MTATVREQILDAVVAALNAAPPAGVPTTTRTQISVSEQIDLPSISVYPVREEVNSSPEHLGRFGPLIERTLYIRIMVIVAGDVPDSAADPIVGYVSGTLSGASLGGLVNDSVEHGSEWLYSEVNQRECGVLIDFRLDYQTSRTDPTSTT
jgi:hypothetical protein